MQTNELINELRIGLKALGWISPENEIFATDGVIIDTALCMAISRVKQWLSAEKSLDEEKK